LNIFIFIVSVSYWGTNFYSASSISLWSYWIIVRRFWFSF